MNDKFCKICGCELEWEECWACYGWVIILDDDREGEHEP